MDYYFFKTNFTLESRVASDLQFFYLDFPSTGITDVCIHAQKSLVVLYLKKINLVELRTNTQKSAYLLSVRWQYEFVRFFFGTTILILLKLDLGAGEIL